MTTEAKWRIAWAGWLVAGIVGEAVALRTKHDHAPLSHHLRQNTHLLGKTHVGRVALLFGAAWLHRHLYRPMLEEAKSGRDHPRVVLHVDGNGGSPDLRAWVAGNIRRAYDRRAR